MNKAKLLGKIAESGQTRATLAKALGIDRATFYRRIAKGTLTLTDAQAISANLSLSPTEACEIFLTE